MLNPKMIRVVQKRGMTPTMTSSGEKMSIAQTMAMLMMRPNSPKVSILTGRVMIFRMGLMKKLTKPSKTPAIAKLFRLPVKLTPGTKLTAIHNPKTLETILTKKFRIIS